MLRWRITTAPGDGLSLRLGRSKPSAYTGHRAAKSICSKAFRIAFVVFGALALAFFTTGISHAQGADPEAARVSDAERASYADALDYCRGDVPHPEALRADGRVLCLDGWIFAGNDILLANRLEHGGIFVVRNSGGDADGAIALASLLRIKEATVVINDYCVAICANYLFTSTAKAFVPKDALVAWTVGDRNGYCVGFSEMSDPRAPRLVAAPCPGAGAPADPRNDGPLRRSRDGKEMIGPEQPPESVFVRKILKRKFDESGRYPVHFLWTGNSGRLRQHDPDAGDLRGVSAEPGTGRCDGEEIRLPVSGNLGSVAKNCRPPCGVQVWRRSSMSDFFLPRIASKNKWAARF